MFSWYQYLIVDLVFSHLGYWSMNLFLIVPFPELCLLYLLLMSNKNAHVLVGGDFNCGDIDIVYFCVSPVSFRQYNVYLFSLNMCHKINQKNAPGPYGWPRVRFFYINERIWTVSMTI